MSLNRVQLIGRLAADPQGVGETGCALRIATNRAYTDKEGQKVEEATFSRVVCWNGLAKQCATYLKKGRMVYVEGRLSNRVRENEDGTKTYFDDIVATDVQFLDSPKSQEAPAAV